MRSMRSLKVASTVRMVMMALQMAAMQMAAMQTVMAMAVSNS